METINSWELGEILKTEFDAETGTALSNLFVVGCFLHLNGEREAGLKACSSALKAIKNSKIKTNFNSIISTLEGNEEQYASLVSANVEVNKLFKTSGDVDQP